MNLRCLAEIAAHYRGRSQVARTVTEEWCAREMYCPACKSDRLKQSKANTPAIDFMCPVCNQLFQLKSSQKWNSREIPDAGYDAMVRAIRADRTPNLLVMRYSGDWVVTNLLLIPRVFFTESIVKKRKPLSPHAKRAGWVGCNILLHALPEDGKIDVVSFGRVIGMEQVRSEFSRICKLSELPPHLRGWTVDVLGIIRRLGKQEFTLRDLYEFEAALRDLHPQNRHIRPKIRQQLQILRDIGILSFKSPGCYRIVSHEK
jgi:type II restriction enzyme